MQQNERFQFILQIMFGSILAEPKTIGTAESNTIVQ